MSRLDKIVISVAAAMVVLCAFSLMALGQFVKVVAFDERADGTVLASVTIDGKDAWPGGHWLNAEELALYAANGKDRDLLRVRLLAIAEKMTLERFAQDAPVPFVKADAKIVDAAVEKAAAEKQAEIDAKVKP